MGSFMKLRQETPIPFPDGDYPLFNRISIETISWCNRSCHFCPVAWGDRGEPKVAMTDQLFGKIAEELSQLEFDGVAQLFFLSEPMVDKTLQRKADYLRECCPKSSTYISSNGDVLDSIAKSRGIEAALERLDSYYQAGINVININVYDPGPAQYERYKALEAAAQAKLGCLHTGNKYRHHRRTGKFLCITDMRFGERGAEETTKGTDIFYIRNLKDRQELEQQNVQVPQLYCARTQRHLVVLYDGSVPICCAIDPNDKTTIVNNINTATLKEVWESEVFYKYRYFTQDARRVLPHCKTCTHKMGGFPHIVRLVKPEESTRLAWEGEVR
jgi:iron-sulfur cluster protein/radical SAM family protein